MKVTFEQLKQAMLDDGWVHEESRLRYSEVFTKKGRVECWYSADKNIWFNSYSNKRYLIEQLYKKTTKGKKMKQPTLKIKKLYPNIELPTPAYATSGSAGIDLCAVIDSSLDISNYRLEAQNTVFVNTGVAVSIPKGYVGLIMPRSGLGTKGLVLGNLTGVIDSDYRGEIILQLWNRSNTPILIENLDRVAQMLIVPVAQPAIEVVDELDTTERGDKGFGSTGK